MSKKSGAHRGVRCVIALTKEPRTPGHSPPDYLLTSWKYLYSRTQDFLSCASSAMGAASSSEVVAEKLREMGEGAAQRP